MEVLCAKYQDEKNKILNMIACDNPCWKDKTKNLERLKEDIKVRFICFEDDINEVLDKCQYKKFKSFIDSFSLEYWLKFIQVMIINI